MFAVRFEIVGLGTASRESDAERGESNVVPRLLSDGQTLARAAARTSDGQPTAETQARCVKRPESGPRPPDRPGRGRGGGAKP